MGLYLKSIALFLFLVIMIYILANQIKIIKKYVQIFLNLKLFIILIISIILGISNINIQEKSLIQFIKKMKN